jgi:hypothetical protein
VPARHNSSRIVATGAAQWATASVPLTIPEFAATKDVL